MGVREEARGGGGGGKNSLGLARYLAILADARRRHGQLQGAQAACMRAALAVSSDSRWVEPEVRRVEALLARDLRPQEPKEAEAGLQRAAECARELGFPAFERPRLLDLPSPLPPPPPNP